jgi:hypothetical protein
MNTQNLRFFKFKYFFSKVMKNMNYKQSFHIYIYIYSLVLIVIPTKVDGRWKRQGEFCRL